MHGMVFGHYNLAAEWVKAGHEVTILASSYSHTRTRQPDPAPEQWIDGIRYVWLPAPRYRPESWLRRIHSILSFSARCWFSGPKIGPVDLVICSSHHPFAIHAARRIAALNKARLIFEVRDLWPLTLIELGNASRYNPFVWAMQWSEDYAYRVADKVVSVLSNSKEYMVGRGMSPQKFVFVPNGVDALKEERTLPPGHGATILKHRKAGRLVVGYAGRIGLANALETLIEAVALLDDAPIAVAILGHGPLLSAVRKAAQRLNISDRIEFLAPVPISQVTEFMRMIDVGYVGLSNSRVFSYGTGSTKINDYMVAGKPIVSAMGAPDNPVALSGAGFVCPPEDSAAVADALRRILAMPPHEREALGNRGRTWIRTYRRNSLLAQQFLEAAFQD